MSNLTDVRDFSGAIQLIAVRPVPSGYSRVWGWLIDGERSVTFWMHRPTAGFSFKIAETYAGNRTVTEKVDEKLEAHGYIELQRDTSRWNRLAARLHREYLEVQANDGFHVGGG